MILAAGSSLQIHTNVLPVAKGLTCQITALTTQPIIITMSSIQMVRPWEKESHVEMTRDPYTCR